MRHHRQKTLLTIGSVLVALAPKCPVCFLAYFGIFGVTATSVSSYHTWLPPVTAVWLALTVAMLFVRTNGRRRHVPVAIGLIAALSVFTGRFVITSAWIVYLGLAALVGAALWSSRLRTSVSSPACLSCEAPSRVTIERRGSPA